MIPLTRHLNPNLALLLDQTEVEARANPSGGDLICDVVTFADLSAARRALAAYHAERWNRAVGEAGPTGIRLSDLGELVAALLLHSQQVHVPDSIYPLTFTSPGPTAQLAGIDVLGMRLDLGAGPLAVHERLSVAEAKTTLTTSSAGAISGIQEDVKKCTAERIADSLFVLQWEFEQVGDPNSSRVHLFITAQSAIYGSIVIDPLKCDLDKTVLSIFSRLEGKASPTGAPLARVFLLALPNAETFVEATL